MALLRNPCLCSLFLYSSLLNAQEVKYIDLSVSQFTELRHPPAPHCETDVCGGYSWGRVADGGPNVPGPQSIGVYLLHVSPIRIMPLKPFEAEFRILNSGVATIVLPVSPHLSDMQPADESRPFSYFSLALVVSIKEDSRHAALAVAELYGATDREGTMLTLQPGEWIRVKAKLTPRFSPEETGTIHLLGGFWFRTNTFTPHPGGGFVSAKNLYPNATATPPVPVRILGRRDMPKQ
jgi:hypothetical protein